LASEADGELALEVEEDRELDEDRELELDEELEPELELALEEPGL
jgi:hypothetical protein